MTADTLQDILTEAELLQRGQALLDEIQATLAKFTDVKLELASHKNDEAAHPFIQEQIRAVVDSTGFATQEEVKGIVKAYIDAHKEDVTAHPPISTIITQIQTAIAALTLRVDVLDPPNPDDPQTALEIALAAVDAKYDPTLDLLKQAYETAKRDNTGTADDIAAQINQVMLQKAAARYQVLLEFEYYS